MNILQIKKYPDPILRKKCDPVKEITPEETALFDEMLHTIRTFKGIGLAAPQVGILLRIIVADIGEGPVKLVNPAVVKVKGEGKMTEGCLSIPDINIEIKRPFEAVVVGLNEKGKVVEVKAKGLLARVLQHEIDHLNGKLIIDYAGIWRRLILKSRFKKS